MATEHGHPPGYRFVPTEEELVELCLLPRIQNQPLLRNDIIADDPLSAPPWALLEKHGRKHQAFFFAACQAMNAKGNRQKRTCEGHGTWQGQGKRKRKRGGEEEEGQEEVKQKKLRVRQKNAKEMEIEWDMYALNFHERGVHGSSGWVMHEYSITAPPELARSPLRVYCIRFSGHGKNAKKNSRDAQHRDDDELEDDDDDEVDDDAAGAIPTATCGAAAEEDPAALFFDEVEDNAAGGIASATWSATEEDAALLVEEYLASFPLVEVDVLGANPAAGADAGAGYDQDLPALVDDDSLVFMNSLPDLLPDFD